MEQSLNQSGDIEFLISNLSLPMSYVFGRNLHDHEKYMKDTGADGLEITPMYFSRFINRLVYRSMVLEESLAVDAQEAGQDHFEAGEDVIPFTRHTLEDEAYQNIVRSGHSSFRNSSGDNGPVALAFPPWQQSLDMLDKVQVATGRLPVVLYPNFEAGEVRYNDDNAPFTERTFQPTPSDWRDMELNEYSSISDIKDALHWRGFDGITFDLFHTQVGSRIEKFRNPVDLASRLALGGLIKSVHLSVNRLDITGLRSDLARRTKFAKKSFVQSASAASRTIEGQILSNIAYIWKQNAPDINDPPRRIVIEEGPIRSGNTKRNHTAIIANARELVDQA